MQPCSGEGLTRGHRAREGEPTGVIPEAPSPQVAHSGERVLPAQGHTSGLLAWRTVSISHTRAISGLFPGCPQSRTPALSPSVTVVPPGSQEGVSGGQPAAGAVLSQAHGTGQPVRPLSPPPLWARPPPGTASPRPSLLLKLLPRDPRLLPLRLRPHGPPHVALSPEVPSTPRTPGPSVPSRRPGSRTCPCGTTTSTTTGRSSWAALCPRCKAATGRWSRSTWASTSSGTRARATSPRACG